MNTTLDNVPLDEHIALKKSYQVLSGNYQKLQSDHQYLQQQLSELKRMIFGSKSERFIPLDSGQLGLFTTQEQSPELEDVPTIEVSYNKNKAVTKQQPIRSVLPSHLPRIEEIIEPEGLTQGAKKIGEEITEILEYNPAKIFVRKIIRPKYVINSEQIVIGNLPCLPIPKGNAGAGLLAHIITSKFVDHLPFYRQRQILKRQELIVGETTIGGWFNASADLLKPLYDALEKQILQGRYLQIDESPIGVQDSHKKGNLHRGYHWVYHAPVEGLVLFKYDPSRSKEVLQTFLQDYKGTVQSDGYTAYQYLEDKKDIVLLSCMAHARRYFEKALENDVSRAGHALKHIQGLYAIERRAREAGVDFQVRKRYRRLYARPILNALEKWLKEQILLVLPKSSIGKAIAYTLRLWPRLIRYAEDGRYQIDNNLIENTIRPLALGRKNYLFAGSHKAAQRAAMFYSFFATCKINDIEPYAWLKDVLERIPEHKANRLGELLPLADYWKKQQADHSMDIGITYYK